MKMNPDSLLQPTPSSIPIESTSPVTLNQLPNELLQSILSYLPIQQLIHLRVVCTRWQNIIESMQQANRCLILTDLDIPKEKHIKRRFFGQINLNGFVCLKLKPLEQDAGQNEYFRSLIRRLFPLIEQLLINLLEPNLLFVLTLWPVEQITTLSIERIVFDEDEGEHDCEDLANRINSLTSLRRLDLVGNAHGFFDALLHPTLGIIEHFSCYAEYSDYNREDKLPELFSHLGQNCSRFWINNAELNSYNILQWHSTNPQWLSRLTHLRLNIEDGEDEVFRYLGQHATSVQVLHINACTQNPTITPEMLGHLARKTHLTELKIFNVLITDWYEWEKMNVDNRSLKFQMNSVQTVHLQIVDKTDENWKNVLKDVLAILFPNVQHLSIE